jgi:hypothetical protein
VTITRTSFTGAVTLSLGGAPAGVTGAFVPNGTTGTSSTLTVTVSGSVAPGVYNLTVDGTGTPGSRSTNLTLTVTGAGPGNVTVDFSGCTVANQPVWLAAQDGTGPWIVITPVANVYTFSITSGKGGMAYVVEDGAGNTTLFVQYLTQAEFTSGRSFCTPAGKTITGTVAGIGATDLAQISLGGATTTASTLTSLNFTLAGVADGNQDLVGFTHDVGGINPDSAIIRRDQNIADGGSVGTMNFGTEGFEATTATMTGVGLVGGETATQTMNYRMGSACVLAPLYSGVPAGASFQASGIPSGQQRVDDFHGMQFVATTPGSGSRLVTQWFHTMGPQTLTLGAAMPIPTITQLAGTYLRLQAVYMLPSDYQTQTFFAYSRSSNVVSIIASFGYLGGSAITLGLDNFSGLAGWNDAFAPSIGTAVWFTSGLGRSTASPCTEGATVKNAMAQGSF